MEYKTVQISKDYSKFYNSSENRDVDLKSSNARDLRKSFKENGWIPSFPMSVYKNGKNGYKILDGQHRFAIARELGMPVKFVEVDQEFEISEINQMQKGWSLKDYMKRWQKAGKKDYFEIEEFIQAHPNIPLSSAISLLFNNASLTGGLNKKFKYGDFHITPNSRGVAYRIANAYESIIEISRDAKHSNHLSAIIMCFRVDEFDIDRLVEQYDKNPSMIQNCSKTDDWLDLVEEVYNHQKRNRIPLKFLAREKVNNQY